MKMKDHIEQPTSLVSDVQNPQRIWIDIYRRNNVVLADKDAGLRAVLQPKNNSVSLLSVKDVIRRTSLSKGQIYHLMSRGEFPQTVSLSPGRRAWVDAEINDWIKNRMMERNSALGGWLHALLSGGILWSEVRNEGRYF